MSEYTKYIDADDLPWHVVTTKIDDELTVSKLMVDWEDVYRKTPSADVAPVVHAHWIWRLADNGWADTICSNCNHLWNMDIHVSLDYDYCPYCGAKMDET